MDNNANVPYAVHEGSQVRDERTIKRLIAVIIVLIVLLFASNMAWLYAWRSYDYVSEESQIEYSQDGAGINNINTGSQGDVNGAETYSYNKKTDTP